MQSALIISQFSYSHGIKDKHLFGAFYDTMSPAIRMHYGKIGLEIYTYKKREKINITISYLILNVLPETNTFCDTPNFFVAEEYIQACD